MAQKQKKSFGKKLATTAITAIAIAAASIFAYNHFIGDPTPPTPPTPETQLVAPANLTYDGDTYILDWDDVEHATHYTVDFNGQTVVVEDSEVKIAPAAEETTFKVKATDATGDYTESNWSQSITHVVEQSDILGKIATKFNTLVNGYEFVQLHSIHVGNTLQSGNHRVTFSCEYKRHNINYLINVSQLFSPETVTLDDYLNVLSNEKVDYDITKMSQYDSASSFLQSNSYDGQLEQYRQDGWTISVVSSITTELSGTSAGSSFRLCAIYKLERGSEVKYVTSNNLITLNVANSNSWVDYTNSVQNTSFRTVYEQEFTELEGDYLDVAKLLEASKVTSTSYGAER